MNRKPEKEFSAFHLFLGLLIGFLLGTTLVYWHNNRQNDRLVAEAMDKVINMFSDHGFHLDNPGSNEEAGNNQGSIQNNPMSTNRAFLPSASSPNNMIAQDRLLHSTILTIRKTDKNESQNARKLDSLIGNTSPAGQEDIYVIEFWESPLNSIGYKMGKNKIVLYGIHSFDMVSLAKHDEKIYLRYFNELYPLEFTTSFKPLIPVNEPYFLRDFEPF